MRKLLLTVVLLFSAISAISVSAAAHAADYLGVGVTSSSQFGASYEHRGFSDAKNSGIRVEFMTLNDGKHVANGHWVGYLPIDPNVSFFAGGGLSMVRGAAGPSLTVGFQSEANGVFFRVADVHSNVKSEVTVDAVVFTLGAVF